MKNSKSFPLLLIVTFVFACVMSCDDQDERLETKSTFGKDESVPNARVSLSAPSAVDAKVGDPISLATAQKWTSNYRKDNPNEALAHFFGFEIIQQILNQEGCIGIRIYYATNDAGEKQLLLVGVDADGENLVPSAGAKIDGDGDIIADASFPCPDVCPRVGL